MDHAAAISPEVIMNAPCDVGALVGGSFAANDAESDMRLRYDLADPACITSARDCWAPVGVEDASALMLSARTPGQGGHDFMLTPSLLSSVESNASCSDDKEEGEISDDEEDVRQSGTEQPVAKVLHGFPYHMNVNKQQQLNIASPFYPFATSHDGMPQSSSSTTLPPLPSANKPNKRRRTGAGSMERFRQRRKIKLKDSDKKERRRLARLQDRLAAAGTTVTVLSESVDMI
ncbi:uncharacterized protein C8Q71DRAFT_82511 [Rhodofomes roseus]|uniref:BZIP domain-containing protein n=1 Tax=Rhodofomes roseus TaxID=34475 RepID=A0ABQ8KFK5_9APHY|nr:uncharacterized protein C8Q71DRAFT_82511 [Rhodofomes roseus]KAH9836404.1 hypothetical protein C8Q71DRAFT_82511 [Rhodofomes roseus]